MRNCVFRVICALLSFLLFMTTSCAKESNNKESTGEAVQDINVTGKEAAVNEPTDYKGEGTMDSTEEKRIELQHDMIDFWRAHREEMESFAAQMKSLEENDIHHSYLYAVKENALYVFDGVERKSQEKLMEHAILSETAFFAETQAFEWVAWSSNWFDRSACTYTGEVYDGDSGELYAELYLFFSKEVPVTDEYRIVEHLDENWYFYCEYKE